MEHVIDSPVGPLRLRAEDDALVAVEFDAAPPDAGDPRAPLLAEAARQLRQYFAGERRDFDLPLRPAGTDFQRAVWSALRRVPYAETQSYADIARALGRPSATRAVGAANGQNPVAIIIPCHRVIGADGRLTGYGGGLPRKQWLLAHEARVAGHALL
jgi:methylated-DNA-[protein]-cysteine S-methyltransferase